MIKKNYHKLWRTRNKERIERYSENYLANNIEERKETIKKYRDKTKTNRSSYIKQIIRTAKNNAIRKDMKFELTFEVIQAWLIVQNDRCALTKIKFDYENHISYRNRPFTPSIDRKDNSKGYLLSNIQIVCSIVNRAKNENTQDDFDMMCIERVKQINEKY